MTKFVPVPPKNAPWWGDLGNWAVLAQAEWVLQDPDYRAFMRNRSLSRIKILLDWIHPIAGQMPKHDLTIDHYWAAINIIRPWEAIIPDVYMNAKATLSSAATFLDDSRCSTSLAPQWMFVPQGDDPAEFLECMKDGLHEFKSYVSTVGVPMWIEAACPRKELVSEILAGIHNYGSGQTIHMLGIWKSCHEMFHDARVRSWDTSLPFSSAHSELPLNSGGRPAQLLSDNPNKVRSYNLHGNAPDIIAHFAVENVHYVKGLLNGSIVPGSTPNDP